MTAKTDAIGGRVRQFREELDISQEEMGTRIAALVGGGTNSTRISEWERGVGRSPESLATVAFLHPRPRMCLLWLRNGGEMPGIRVDWADRPREGESDADYLRRKGGALVRLGEAYLKAATDLKPLDLELEIPSLSALVSSDKAKGRGRKRKV